MSRVLWYTQLSKWLVIDRGDNRLRFFPTGSSATIWISPEKRRADEKFIDEYLRPGDVFLDVGANIGTSTLVAAAIVGKSGKVYSVEAHPRIYQYLRANVALNSFYHVQLFNAAVGNTEGTVQFSDKYSDTMNHVVADNGIRVPLRTLNQLLSGDELTSIELLKIDVEGYEKFVIQGASSVLPVT